MRIYQPIAHLLLVSAALVASGAALGGMNGQDGISNVRRNSEDTVPLLPRDEHEHMHMGGAPLTELNETLVLQWHPPTPPSYATHDFEDPDVKHKYPYLMGMHALSMSLAFFGALPIGIALRSVNHGLHGVTVAAFYGFIVLGLSFSALYRKLTPNMYEGQKHGSHGYFVIFFALALTIIDGLTAIYRAVRYFTALRRGEIDFSVKGLWRCVVLNKENEVLGDGIDHEYAGLAVGEPEEFDINDIEAHHFKGSGELGTVDLGVASPASSSTQEDSTVRWSNNMRDLHRQHRDRGSRWGSGESDGTLFNAHADPTRRGSDDTLHELAPHITPVDVKLPLIKRVGRAAFATAERVLVFLAYMQVLTGGVVYTGICRNSWVNGCLAHLIKGGIFWCYGLVSFARFLGSFSELGWAWNLAPLADKTPSAEFVESLVIFVYGISNTWMERFGVAPGSPFTTKQIQHISIAVMFWFSGLVGMGLESKTLRRWLAAPASALVEPAQNHLSNRGRSASPSSSEGTAPPPSYRASFNPFPALTIGVTGLAMAAHAQVYLFQVQVHSLWGQLLAGFALLRCLTYFFLFLSPPSSPLPSRPPTEALASFFLACGGLVFQSSTEEISLAAMRRGHDDVMMFLNVAVAVTCLAFCWVGAVVTFKAWLKVRQLRRAAVKRQVGKA